MYYDKEPEIRRLRIGVVSHSLESAYQCLEYIASIHESASLHKQIGRLICEDAEYEAMSSNEERWRGSSYDQMIVCGLLDADGVDGRIISVLRRSCVPEEFLVQYLEY